MGNLKRRKDGRIRKTVRINKKPEYVYGYSQADVDAEATELKNKRNHGDIANPGKLTVAGYLKTWLKSRTKKIEPSTYSGYENYVNNHIAEDELGDILLKDLKPLHIESFYGNEMEKERTDKAGNVIVGYSNKTILQEHRILHKAFKQAVRNELLYRNPCDYVDVPKVEEYQLTVYDENQFNVLLDAVVDTPDEIPILLAGMCGLRRSEVFGLPWSDIDIGKETISINQVVTYSKEEKKWLIKERPKNMSSRRTFSIPSEIIPILKAKKGIGLVCCKEDGGIINGGTFSHHFSDLLKENKLPHIRFHDLRHFNATMMLKYRISDKEAAKRLGHANPNTLRKTYQHVLDEMDRHNATTLNQIIHRKRSEGQNEGQTKK